MARTAYPLGRALEFLESVWRVNHAMQRVSTRMLHVLGVTGPQRLVIRCVGQHPGISSSQLAELLHLDRGSVSAALTRLEGMRFLERRPDPDDGRRATLHLTPTGRRIDRPTKHTIEATVEHVIGTASASDLEATVRTLGELAARLEHEADRD